MRRIVRSSVAGRRALRSLPLVLLAAALVLPSTVYGFTEPVPLEIEKITKGAEDMPPAADGYSQEAAITPDGRYIAFASDASNLVEGDTNRTTDVFVLDTITGITERVSLSSEGLEGSDSSYEPSISDDGRYVAFRSYAGDLVTGDTNYTSDVFVHDRDTGETERVSVSSAGVQANGYSYTPAISGDGRHVAFVSSSQGLAPGDDALWYEKVYAHDRETGTTVLVSAKLAGLSGNQSSYEPSVSYDGRFVAFRSYVSDLVPSDTNGTSDIFVRDMVVGVTRRVSVSSAGLQGSGESYQPSISSDGRWVAFTSQANNLVASDTNYGADIFVHDLMSGITELVSVSSAGLQGSGTSYYPSISNDGRFVSFGSYAALAGDDTNGFEDIYLRDRQLGTTVRVSVADDGGDPDYWSNEARVSDDGDRVAFMSVATNLVADDWAGYPDIFYRDIAAGTTTLASAGDVITEPMDDSRFSRISADGRYVVFQTWAPNLVLGDTNDDNDIFVHDRETGELEMVSVSSEGVQGDSCSSHPSISADGRYVAFQSRAGNLVEDDTNGYADVFVHDRETGVTERVSLSTDGVQTGDCSSWPYISADGNAVVFRSEWDIAAEDTNGYVDIYVHYRDTGVTELVSVNTEGVAGDDGAHWPSPNQDGTIIAFRSEASDLVEGDTNGNADIFVRDMTAGVTERVSVSTLGAEADDCSRWPSITADGRYVAFQSGARNLIDDAPEEWNDGDIFVRDREEGTTIRITNGDPDAAPIDIRGIIEDPEASDEANGCSANPAISADGAYVVYSSEASNLVADDTNDTTDVFAYEMATGSTARVAAVYGSEGSGPLKVAASREPAKPSISADGTYVAFCSNASDLIPGLTVNSWVDQVYVAKVTERDSAPQIAPIGNRIIAEGKKFAFTASAVDLESQVVTFTLDPSAPEGAAITPDGEFTWTPTEAQGPRTYELTVTASDGVLTSSASFILRVVEVNVPPVLAPIGAKSVDEGSELTFTATATDSDLPAQMVTFSLGDDAPEGATITPGGVFSWTPTEEQGPAVHAVTVIASDGVATDSELVFVNVGAVDVTVTPVQGDDRVGTALEVSRQAFPDGAVYALVATAFDWPDAICGSGLAGALDAPILLTAPDQLPDAVKAEIERLGATDIIVLGGTSVVSDAVRDQLAALPGVESVERIAGGNRYETADAVVARTLTELGAAWDGTALVSTGAAFPDALGASPLAAGKGWPLYLVQPDAATHAARAAALEADGVTNAVILGGTGVVPASFESALADVIGAGAVDRIAGGNRYETAALVAEYGVSQAGLGWDGVAFATGENFPDALAGGVLQGRAGSVMLLTPSDMLAPSARAALIAHGDSISEVRFFGGTSAVSTSVRLEVANLLAE